MLLLAICLAWLLARTDLFTCLFACFADLFACREVEEGYNTCDLCGFENFKRFHFCNVCGEEIQMDEGRESKKVPKRETLKKLWKSTKHGPIEILSRSSEPPRLTRSQRSRRQRRARYELPARLL